MAIAHDAVSNVAAGAGNLSWTHTPVGTPRGVVVQIVQYQTTATTDQVSGVTYGGVAMSETTDSPLVHTGTLDFGVVHTFFLGASIPTGAQTVSVTVSGADSKRAIVATMTAAADTEVADTTPIGATGANPTLTLTTTAETMCYAAMLTGAANLANVTPDQTEILEHDFGQSGGSWVRLAAADAGSDAVLSWTANAVEYAAVGIAVQEIVSGTIEVPLGLVTETDTAQSIAPLKTVALGQPSETDTAQAITVRKTVALGLPTETNTAQAFTTLKTVALGLPSETDTAQSITPIHVVSLGQATETDSALAITVRKTVAVGIATETDTALPITVDDGSPDPEGGTLALLHAGS